MGYVQWQSLAGDMGGVVGLYIGFSVLTIGEFLEYIVNLIMLAILKAKMRRAEKAGAADAPSNRPKSAARRKSSARSRPRSAKNSTAKATVIPVRPTTPAEAIPMKKVPAGGRPEAPPSYSTVYLNDDKQPLTADTNDSPTSSVVDINAASASIAPSAAAGRSHSSLSVGKTNARPHSPRPGMNAKVSPEILAGVHHPTGSNSATDNANHQQPTTARNIDAIVLQDYTTV